MKGFAPEKGLKAFVIIGMSVLGDTMPA
jgi:hypothetical protein